MKIYDTSAGALVSNDETLHKLQADMERYSTLCPNCRGTHYSFDGNQYCGRCASRFRHMGLPGRLDSAGHFLP